MKPSNMTAIAHDQAQMCRLSADRRSLRMELPDLPVDGLPDPIRVKMDFDARVVDQMIERPLVLRSQMLPAPPLAATRHQYLCIGVLGGCMRASQTRMSDCALLEASLPSRYVASQDKPKMLCRGEPWLRFRPPTTISWLTHGLSLIWRRSCRTDLRRFRQTG